MRVKLTELIDALDTTSEESTSYLDRETGETLIVSDEDTMAFEDGEGDLPEWQQEYLVKIRPILEESALERYVDLPPKFDFHEYAHMEKFVASLSDGTARELLWTAIKGSGAFRRFRDGIHRLGVADDWYRYKNAAMKQFIIEWCDDENVPYEDDTASGPGGHDASG